MLTSHLFFLLLLFLLIWFVAWRQVPRPLLIISEGNRIAWSLYPLSLNPWSTFVTFFAYLACNEVPCFLPYNALKNLIENIDILLLSTAMTRRRRNGITPRWQMFIILYVSWSSFLSMCVAKLYGCFLVPIYSKNTWIWQQQLLIFRMKLHLAVSGTCKFTIFLSFFTLNELICMRLGLLINRGTVGSTSLDEVVYVVFEFLIAPI